MKIPELIWYWQFRELRDLRSGSSSMAFDLSRQKFIRVSVERISRRAKACQCRSTMIIIDLNHCTENLHVIYSVYDFIF